MALSNSTRFACLQEENLDTNSTSTVSSSLDIGENQYISFCVVANTGENANHVMTLQISFDNITWYSTATTLTGVGFIQNVQVTARFARLKVTTAEGESSTVDIYLHAK